MLRLLNVYSIFFIIASFAVAATFRILILHLADPLQILNIHLFLILNLTFLSSWMGGLLPLLIIGIKILIDFIFGLNSIQDFNDLYPSLIFSKFNIVVGFFVYLGIAYFLDKYSYSGFFSSRFSVSSLIAVLITWLVLIVESVVVVKSARAARRKAVKNGLNQRVVVCSLLLLSGLGIALGSGYDILKVL